jgi:signal transduction histidine kinase/predicted metal-dependent HD superfamily phosphohydrolase
MNYQALEPFVLNLLREKLPANIYYHNVPHTQDVIAATLMLCEMEKLDEHTTLLLKTAALLHDTGFTEQYPKNEPIGARLAGEWLPAYGYNEEDIKQIQKLILATASPRNPEGLMEKIICDADLDYLGRNDFFMISQSLRQEWMFQGQIFSLTEWYEMEKDFLEKHIFYTDAAYRMRNKVKQQNLAEIKSLVAGSEGREKSTTAPYKAKGLEPQRASIVVLLRNTTLFGQAEDEMLEQIALMVERIPLGPDEAVFKKGDPGESMYFVEKGSLKVHDGDIVFAHISGGQYFGELALIDSSPRTASVTSREESVILRLGMRDFFILLGSFPSMNRLLMKELINRLRHQNDTVVQEYKTREARLKELVEQRTAEIIEEKKKVEKKSAELEIALQELKEAQRMIIHQEKMASLGQLTNGMAHELLNPLNFVNNFSAVSVELLRDAKSSEDREEIMELIEDVSMNLEKILQHGKRAGDIVRSMAEHTGQVGKERSPVAAHAMLKDAVTVVAKSLLGDARADDVKVTYEFEAQDDALMAVYSELFRLVTNLIRNAYQAVLDRRKKEPGYKGEITIRTRKVGEKMEILIQDDGIGIDGNIREKIFQPFFTTRPTGQGVGLGLSISHQIASAFGCDLDYLPEEPDTTFRLRMPLEM